MTPSIRNITPLLTICAAAVLLSPAQAREIYTWTDENGVVHYVDQPPANHPATVIDAPEAYRPGSRDAYADAGGAEAAPAATEEPATAQLAADTAEGTAAVEPSYADQQREEMARKRAERQRKANERAAICAQARQTLAEVEPNRRVFYTDEAGETVRMDDEDRVELVEESKRQIAENCDSE